MKLGIQFFNHVKSNLTTMIKTNLGCKASGSEFFKAVRKKLAAL
jgi:hypothetical protein